MASLVTSRGGSLWAQARKIPAKYPMAFGVVLSGFKTSFSDLLVQKVVEKREKVDWKRNAAFASFGFLYLGGVQYILYVPIFGRIFPNAASFAAKPLRQKLKDTRGMMHLFAQVFLDQCVHHPIMYFPVFYCTRELVMAEKPDLVKVMKEYRANMKEDLAALWKIWVPGTIINFAFMPMHFRIPFVAGISLVWTCVLSAMRGGDVVHADDLAGGAVTGASFSLLKEGLDENFNMTPVELDENLSHFNISAVAKQRPGLVAMLSRHIADLGGNVTHSKMSRLGQEFVIQMHVAIAREKRNLLLSSLKTEKRLINEFNIQATELTRRDHNDGTNKKAVIGLVINMIGEDRPGMVASIAEKMYSKNMSIEDFVTELRLGKNGQREFVVKALVSSGNLSDKENLDECIQDISSLKEDLNLTTFDVRVHTS